MTKNFNPEDIRQLEGQFYDIASLAHETPEDEDRWFYVYYDLDSETLRYRTSWDYERGIIDQICDDDDKVFYGAISTAEARESDPEDVAEYIISQYSNWN